MPTLYLENRAVLLSWVLINLRLSIGSENINIATRALNVFLNIKFIIFIILCVINAESISTEKIKYLRMNVRKYVKCNVF